MLTTIVQVGALLVTHSLLVVGNGLQGVLVPLRAGVEGYPVAAIGLLAAGYYAGMALGCRWNGVLVRRAGHIRAFAAFAAVTAAAILAHGLSQHPAVWVPLRLLVGACFAGTSMVLESWLNERCDNRVRGSVFSVYMVIHFGGLSFGQLLIVAGDVAGPELFSVVAIFVALSLVPLAVTASVQPQAIETAPFRLGRLIATSPVAVVGSAAIGLANGAFWALFAVYGEGIGMGVDQVALFVSATVVCGAIAQWPIGALSDMVDRRWVIAGQCLAGAAVGLALAWAGGSRDGVLAIALAGLFGATVFPLYSVVVAHAYDFADRDSVVEVSGGLLMVFALGAIVGPLVAGLVMEAAGPRSLFVWTAAIHVGVAAFALYRITRRARPPEAERTVHLPIRPTSPAAAVFDPRTPDEGAQPERDAA